MFIKNSDQEKKILSNQEEINHFNSKFENSENEICKLKTDQIRQIFKNEIIINELKENHKSEMKLLKEEILLLLKRKKTLFHLQKYLMDILVLFTV